MLDFRSKKSTVRNYQSRGEQRKLLALVMVVGLFVIVGAEAANPRNLALLWKLSGHGGVERAAPIDNRLGVGVVRAREADAVMIAAADPQPEAAAPVGQVFAGVDPQWFNDVRDDTLFRPADFQTLFNLLDLVAKTDGVTLKKAAIPIPEYVQLFKQPDAYRGKVLTFRGRVEGVIKQEAPPNDQGIKEYYRVWIVHDDRRGMMETCCLELPEGFPVGERLDQPVEFTGIFLKRSAYVARDKSLLSTPLLVARSFKWVPPPPVEPVEKKASGMYVAAGIALGITVVLLFFLMRRRPDQANPFAHSRRKKQEAMGFERLKNLELAPEASEALRRLAKDPPDRQTEAES